MKRMGSITILLAVMAVPAQAQRQGRIRGPGGPDGIGGRAEDGQADAIIRLQERLNLSEEQVQRVRDAQQSDRATRDALRLETRELRDQLRDEAITREQFREEMAGRRSTADDGRIAHRQALEGILTDEQRSQMRGLRGQANRGRGVSRGSRAGRGGPNIGRGNGARAGGGRGGMGRGGTGRGGASVGRGGGFGRAQGQRRNARPSRGPRDFGPL